MPHVDCCSNYKQLNCRPFNQTLEKVYYYALRKKGNATLVLISLQVFLKDQNKQVDLHKVDILYPSFNAWLNLGT
jgi:hypothetical protein